MKEICKDKGAIYVTHRMSSVLIADKIIVLELGRCIEVGTHKELMDLNGVYHNLFLKQAENYKVLQ
jgi:ATP-binding cassette subfamily B protein